MNVVLSGLWVGAAIIASILLLAQTIFAASSAQANGLREASRITLERARTRVSVASMNATDASGGTNIAVRVDNKGEISIVKAAEMDVLVRYTQTNGSLKVERLAYSASCAPPDNQWCRFSLVPDALNPALWDPGEQAQIDVRLVPAVQVGTTATIVVVTPNGISAIGNLVY